MLQSGARRMRVLQQIRPGLEHAIYCCVAGCPCHLPGAARLLHKRTEALRQSRRFVSVASWTRHPRPRAIVMRPSLIGMLLADPGRTLGICLCRSRTLNPIWTAQSHVQDWQSAVRDVRRLRHGDLLEQGAEDGEIRGHLETRHVDLNASHLGSDRSGPQDDCRRSSECHRLTGS